MGGPKRTLHPRGCIPSVKAWGSEDRQGGGRKGRIEQRPGVRGGRGLPKNTPDRSFCDVGFSEAGVDFYLLPHFTWSPFTLECELDQMQWAFAFGKLKLEARVVAFDLRNRERFGTPNGQSLRDLDTRLDDAKRDEIGSGSDWWTDPARNRQ